MPISRREFLARTGLVVAGSVLPVPKIVRASTADAISDWSAFRNLFDLSREYIHMATFFLASHPRPVRESIEKYRRQMDDNPVLFVERGMFEAEYEHLPSRVQNAAADYVGGKPEEIAITNSTTMGLALIYSGLSLKPGQEILTTNHDHFSHHESIRLATLKVGASMRKIALFDDYDSVTEEGIVSRIVKAVRPETRAVGITWVHSASGVKLPLRSIANAIKQANENRTDDNRVFLIVDGVHGFGVENETIADIGLDFFAAGTHKWIFGPRGTGIVWAPEKNWGLMQPTIPSFYSNDVYGAWMRNATPVPPVRASWVSPGGFHPYEHEWAVAEAFQLHQKLGKKRVADRIHELNRQCKEGLATMKHVKMYTPRTENLSAGLICFDVNGMKPEVVVQKLLEKKIVASTTPYGVSYARLAPSLINTPGEVETTLAAIRAMAG
jgi:isopenicillin-N epimerase